MNHGHSARFARYAPDQILNFTRMFDDNNVTSGDIVRPQNADFIVVWMRDSEFSGKNVNEAVRSNRLGFHGTQLWGRFFKMGKLSDEGWYVSGCFLQGNAIDHEHHFVCKKNGSFVKKGSKYFTLSCIWKPLRSTFWGQIYSLDA